MATTNPEGDKLCFVTVVFPVVDDAEAFRLKAKLAVVLAELPRVKIDFRITEVKNDGAVGHESGGADLPG